jgi:hypothetical protein
MSLIYVPSLRPTYLHQPNRTGRTYLIYTDHQTYESARRLTISQPRLPFSRHYMLLRAAPVQSVLSLMRHDPRNQESYLILSTSLRYVARCVLTVHTNQPLSIILRLHSQ